MTTTATNNNHHLACNKADLTALDLALSLGTVHCLHSNSGLGRNRDNSRLTKAMKEGRSVDQQCHHQAGEM